MNLFGARRGGKAAPAETEAPIPDPAGARRAPAGGRYIPWEEIVMYKKQMTVQKILCLVAIIVSGIFFLYSLGIMTDLYDSLYTTMRNPNNINQTSVPGSQIYYYLQEFNRMLLMCSSGLIMLAALLYLTNTHIRRL